MFLFLLFTFLLNSFCKKLLHNQRRFNRCSQRISSSHKVIKDFQLLLLLNIAVCYVVVNVFAAIVFHTVVVVFQSCCCYAFVVVVVVMLLLLLLLLCFVLLLFLLLQCFLMLVLYFDIVVVVFFLNIFLVWLALFSCLFFFVIFSPIKWSFHLVFRWGQDSNSRPRTMARIVSPRRLPLDQGASLYCCCSCCFAVAVIFAAVVVVVVVVVIDVRNYDFFWTSWATLKIICDQIKSGIFFYIEKVEFKPMVTRCNQLFKNELW